LPIRKNVAGTWWRSSRSRILGVHTGWGPSSMVNATALSGKAGPGTDPDALPVRVETAIRRTVVHVHHVLPNHDPNLPADISVEQTIRTATLTVTPTKSDWYGALISRDTWWGLASTVRISTS
jgi:hypothetical protein